MKPKRVSNLLTEDEISATSGCRIGGRYKAGGITPSCS